MSKLGFFKHIFRRHSVCTSFCCRASDQEKTPHFLERTFPDVASPELLMKEPVNSDLFSGTNRAKGSSSRRSSPPDSPNMNLTWSIRQEVERLMKAQNIHDAETSSQISNRKKQSVRKLSELSEYAVFRIKAESQTNFLR